jgi:hypothetical protein
LTRIGDVNISAVWSHGAGGGVIADFQRRGRHRGVARPGAVDHAHGVVVFVGYVGVLAIGGDRDGCRLVPDRHRSVLRHHGVRRAEVVDDAQVVVTGVSHQRVVTVGCNGDGIGAVADVEVAHVDGGVGAVRIVDHAHVVVPVVDHVGVLAVRSYGDGGGVVADGQGGTYAGIG